MIRHAAAVAIVVCLPPSWLYAQSPEFTVTATRAEVHKSPSTGSPVIGTAARGKVFRVTQELGSWVKISWPVAEEGVGYLHVNTGQVAHSALPASNRTVSPTPATRQAPPSASTTATGVQVTAGVQPAGRATTPQPPNLAPISISPTAHLVGIGGRIGGSTLGVGGSVRASMGHRLGIQVEVSRYARTTAVNPERLTSLQFAPSVLYSLPDGVSDYVWVRPYIGAGMTVYRSTLSGGTPVGGVSVTNNKLGRQVFGGTEVTLAAVPRFTLSADYGYRWPQSPFAGLELGGRGLSMSGHWYIK